MKQATEPIEHFRNCSAILEGHFRLSSGRHSSSYLQCARVLMYPDRAETLCRELRDRYEGEAPDVVCGPAIGGITFSYEIARAFGCPGIFVERSEGTFTLRRGFNLEPGTRVLVAEDVVTTGGSVIEACQVLQQLGAVVVGIVTLVHRSDDNPFDVPLTSLLRLPLESYEKQDCPLCDEGLPLVKPGSRPDPVT